MTLQKFYENVILETYKNATEDPIVSEASQIGYDKLQDMSFSEFMITRNMFGFPDNIPHKQNFKKWGIGYIAQLLGFFTTFTNTRLEGEFINLIQKHKLIDVTNKDHRDILYYAVIDGFMKNRDLIMEIFSLILNNSDCFINDKIFLEILSIIEVSGCIKNEELDGFFELKRKYYETENK